jgi:hypothetical protein
LKVRGNLGLTGEAASVDSELTLLYFDLHGRAHPLPAGVANPFFGKTTRRFVIPISRSIWSLVWPDSILTTSRASSIARSLPAIAENS